MHVPLHAVQVITNKPISNKSPGINLGNRRRHLFSFLNTAVAESSAAMPLVYSQHLHRFGPSIDAAVHISQGNAANWLEISVRTKSVVRLENATTLAGSTVAYTYVRTS